MNAYIDKFGHLIITIFDKKWDLGKIRRLGGGGGNSNSTLPFKYTNTAPMPVSVGGYPAGTTFDNIDLNTLWTGLLYNAERPVFTDFYINLESTAFEVGDSIVSFTYQATWHITYPQFLVADTIKIDFIDGNVVTNLASNMPNIIPADIDIPTITSSVAKTVSFKITGDSTLEGQFSRSMLVQFLDRIYVGESKENALDSTQIKDLRIARLADNINGDYQTESGGYKYFCYPVSMGQRYNFIDDATDLEVSMDDPKIVSVTNNFGITKDYYVYRSYYVLNAALKIRVF